MGLNVPKYNPIFIFFGVGIAWEKKSRTFALPIRGWRRKAGEKRGKNREAYKRVSDR